MNNEAASLMNNEKLMKIFAKAKINLNYSLFIKSKKAISFRKHENRFDIAFSYFDDLYFSINCVGVIPIYSLNCLLKK